MLTILPPEILSTIYQSIYPPPLPPCRTLVPYFRQSRFSRLSINSFEQLQHLDNLFLETPLLPQYVKCLEINLFNNAETTTENLLARFERRPDYLRNFFKKLERTREVKCGDWLSSTLGILISSNDSNRTTTTSLLFPQLDRLTLTLLLTQFSNSTFTSQQFSPSLSRYSTLKELDLVVQPYDPGSHSTHAFDLFPSIVPSHSSPFPPPTISNITSLTLAAPLCDLRSQQILSSFSSLISLSLFDLFSSPTHLSPLLLSIPNPHRLRRLKLSQYHAQSLESLTGNLPRNFPRIDFKPFAPSLELLELGIPFESEGGVEGGGGLDYERDLKSLNRLKELRFLENSNPTFQLIHDILINSSSNTSSSTLNGLGVGIGGGGDGMESLETITISNVTGQVGPPISRQTYPLVLKWLSRLFNNDTSEVEEGEEGEGGEGMVGKEFPIKGWKIPTWSNDFEPNQIELLFQIAHHHQHQQTVQSDGKRGRRRGRGIKLDGTLVSAMLVAYLLDKQLESWKNLLEQQEALTSSTTTTQEEEEGNSRAEELRELEEMEQVFGDQRFWDALALRYRARLGLDIVTVFNEFEEEEEVRHEMEMKMEE